jgi:hypothetical protein
MPKPKQILRGILIDPVHRSITEEFITGKNMVSTFIREYGKFTTVAHVYTPEHRYVFVLNDEGLMKPNPGPFWKPRGYPQPLEGPALMMGLTEGPGDYCSNDLPLDFMQARITFPAVRFTGFKESSGEEDHPLLGRVFTVRREAQFEPIPEGSSRSIH